MFDRRRAIECKLNQKVDEETYQYDILVGEKDGTSHWEKSNGKDMRDALENLLWIERHDTIEKLINKASLNAMVVVWIISVIIPGIASQVLDTPLPITITLILNFCLLATSEIRYLPPLTKNL